MPELHEILAERVAGWRATAYAHDTCPAIGEILVYARNEDGSSRYLREPQIRALETAYDGSIFNVAVADIPERKTDVVAGEYRVSMPDGSDAPIAVKVTDMLGEEVLVVLAR